MIGWFNLPEIKHGWLNDCDIGIIVEDEEGERFWSHGIKENIDYQCEIYQKEENG